MILILNLTILILNFTILISTLKLLISNLKDYILANHVFLIFVLFIISVLGLRLIMITFLKNKISYLSSLISSILNDNINAHA